LRRVIILKGQMESLVKWKRRVDIMQDSDNVLGAGDQINDFQDRESPSLTGSPTEVKFIMKDDTNAEAMKHLKMKKWY
jgi:hypothetical protein